MTPETTEEIAAPHLNTNPATVHEAMGAVSASRFLANVALLSVVTAMGGTEEDRAMAKAHLSAALATSREAEDRLVAML